MGQNAKISEIMTTQVQSVDINQKFDDVRKIFETKHLHHIPVTRDGKLAGMLSLTDFFKVTMGAPLVEGGEAFDNDSINKVIYDSIDIADVMTENPVTLSTDSTVKDAVDYFEANMFHAIPVTENGKLAGIVTTFDLIKYMKKLL